MSWWLIQDWRGSWHSRPPLKAFTYHGKIERFVDSNQIACDLLPSWCCWASSEYCRPLIAWSKRTMSEGKLNVSEISWTTRSSPVHENKLNLFERSEQIESVNDTCNECCKMEKKKWSSLKVSLLISLVQELNTFRRWKLLSTASLQLFQIKLDGCGPVKCSLVNG